MGGPRGGIQFYIFARKVLFRLLLARLHTKICIRQRFSVAPQTVIDICEGDMECAFDFVATGSEAIDTGTKEARIEYDHVMEVTSQVVKLCPGQSFLDLENGYSAVTNLQVGGTINFSCKDGFQLPHGPVTCTCTDKNNDTEDPTWICSTGEHPTKCIPIPKEPYLSCEAPPTPRNGIVLGTNYTLGSSLELRCINDSFDIFWKNCKYNGEAGICKEFCNVTYTCMKEEMTLQDGTVETVAIWRGYAGDIAKVGCNSKFVGRIATFLRATSLMVHLSTQGKLVPYPGDNGKPYLVGC